MNLAYNVYAKGNIEVTAMGVSVSIVPDHTQNAVHMRTQLRYNANENMNIGICFNSPDLHHISAGDSVNSCFFTMKTPQTEHDKQYYALEDTYMF